MQEQSIYISNTFYYDLASCVNRFDIVLVDTATANSVLNIIVCSEFARARIIRTTSLTTRHIQISVVLHISTNNNDFIFLNIKKDIVGNTIYFFNAKTLQLSLSWTSITALGDMTC